MKRVQWCNRELFAFPMYYCVCTTPAEFESELKRLKCERRDWPQFQANDHASATVHYLECPPPEQASSKVARRCALVCIAPAHDRDPIEVIALIAHEAVHIVRRGMELIGEREPSAEFEAYTLQGVLQQLLAAYRRQGGFRPS